MEPIFFDSWDGVLRIAITTLIAYLLIVAILRVSGKRTLAKMNAYDFIVTIALGSTLSSVMLNKDIPLAEGLTGIILLIILQFIFTYFSARSNRFRKLISNQPTLLYYENNFIEDAMRQQRVTTSELHKSAREAGHSDLSKIKAIILEPTGDMSVITKEDGNPGNSALEEVQHFKNRKSSED